MNTAVELSQEFPQRTICDALGTSRSTLRRRRQGPQGRSAIAPVRHVPRALSELECMRILAILHSERFVDCAPATIYSTLLDEGVYLCSISTMYRLLRKNAEVRERRRITRHAEYIKPELLATSPRQVFSWDITKLRGAHKGEWYSLLVMIDIFSRFVVGWMLVRRSSAQIAQHFIEQTMQREGIEPGQAVLHADRGPEMTAQPVCVLLDALGVTRSHSRPYVSDDNPYSESQFWTLKSHPDFPDRFSSFEHAHSFLAVFFRWFNTPHRHSGIAMFTPATVHHGHAESVLAARHVVAQAAYKEHPERFVHGEPKRITLPNAVWINPPVHDETAA